MKRLLPKLPSLFYVLTLPLLLLDAYKSDSTLYKYLHLSSRNLALVSIVFFCIFRIFFKQKLSNLLSKINRKIVLPLSLGAGTILAIWGYFTPPNFIYSTFYLQPTQLFLIGLYSEILVFLEQPDDWFRKNYHLIIFLSTFDVLISAFIVSLFPFDVFIKLSQEDNLIENLQVVVLLIGAFWAIRFSRTLYLRKVKIQALIFLMAAMLLLFVSGEEISWGQRIFQIETPKQIAEYNLQKEITVHNLSFFIGYVNIGYVLVGFYGASAWIFQLLYSSLLKKIPFTLYIPPWFCSAYFFLGSLYNFYTLVSRSHFLGVWSELAELMIYMGIMFTLFSLSYENNKILTRKENHK